MSAHDADPSPSVEHGETPAASGLATLGGGGQASPDSAAAEPAGAALVPGMMFGGHYRLERRLGVGGMGEAWEATHVVIKKKVALKVLSPVQDELDFRERSERMLREAKIVASIEHPNIVQIVDFGSTPDGAPYLVMDLVHGCSLREVCRRDGPLAWPRARNLLVQIADALAAAHEQGAIHRDVKPDNVLVTVRGGEEVAKVIDFGIAKSTALEGEARRLTRTGAVCGTPAFMSPEQIRGDAVDARTDVYSLGCLAYELLVGRRPFAGNTPHELIYAHLYRWVECVPGELPVALSAAILRCLHKDPAERFATMGELRDTLARVDGSVMTTVVADPMPPGMSGVPLPPQGWAQELPTGASLELADETAEGTDAPSRRSVWGTVAMAALVTVVVSTAGIWLLNGAQGDETKLEPAAASEADARVAAPQAAAVTAGATAPVTMGTDSGTDSGATTDGAEGTTAAADTGTTEAVEADTTTGATSGETSEGAESATPTVSSGKSDRRRKRPRTPRPVADPKVDEPASEPTVNKPPKRRADGTFDIFH